MNVPLVRTKMERMCKDDPHRSKKRTPRRKKKGLCEMNLCLSCGFTFLKKAVVIFDRDSVLLGSPVPKRNCTKGLIIERNGLCLVTFFFFLERSLAKKKHIVTPRR